MAVARPLSKSTILSWMPPSSTRMPVRSRGGVLDTIGNSISEPHAPGALGHGGVITDGDRVPDGPAAERWVLARGHA